MGRPEPCILFAQTITHPQLDEYVDEVLFAEPVVITACEFLEQNAPLSLPSFSLTGATSPPSFAMEMFVHCEGESRFRRICHPFLYSHSSSNVLEVEAIVTSHLVVRGCYRSITLIVYGNTAEDLGQFNIDFDLDNSLATMVSPLEGKLEDLPPALLSNKLSLEDLISSTKSFSLPVFDSDLSSEMRQFLYLVLKICQISDDDGDIVLKIVRTVVSAVHSLVTNGDCGMVVSGDDRLCSTMHDGKDLKKVLPVLSGARNDLVEIYRCLQTPSGNASQLQVAILYPDSPVATSELLVEMLYQQFPFFRKYASIDLPKLYQNKKLILGLSMVLLVCSARKSCFHFINGGGIEQVVTLLGDETLSSTALQLLILGVIENATRHAVGCEAFLGWWPRNEQNVPTAKSEGYSNLLKLLLRKQRHDVASLASCILQRLRCYEVACRYESSVLSVVVDCTSDFLSEVDTVNSLMLTASQIKTIMKLLNLSGPVDDPSPDAVARRSLGLGKTDGLLSYKTTSNYIALSKYGFSKLDVDVHLLSLLKERGIFPLSAALLSCPSLHSATGRATEIFVEIAVLIELLLLSLLFCRSGLIFLLLQPEVTSTIILSLQSFESKSAVECTTLRQAAVLISKGFFCHPQEVAMIMEIHIRVGNAIDHLLSAKSFSDELLWVLWELCRIARSDCGREAILSIAYFPEAISVLLEALHSFNDSELLSSTDGTSQLGLATFHSAAEIFEILVADSTATSLRAWIGHAMELHKALHLPSPGSHRKDAPTRLLEWIDAGVVYNKNGAIGLLRYAAVLASGGDAHLSSTSVLVSDSIDVENVVGDTSNASDSQVLDILLGKLVNDKSFDGITLQNTSVVQLTTAIRILLFISDNPDVAAFLFEEGAVTLIYVVLVNCKCMLENSSSTYDYLVDGAECNSTSDLLLERTHDQSLADLIIPSLGLLINLLKQLQETKEQYRNKKLLNGLLRLHREVSPRLAAYATDFSSQYPQLVLGLGAICNLITSALAFWPIFGWIPGLFHCLLESVQATSSLALGPKDACSVVCLLSDLFPEEGIWFWRNGIPPLSSVSTLNIETLLGIEVAKDIRWYLHPEHLTVLLVRLTPLLERIAQIVLHFSFTTLTVIKDMLRVFIIRIACQKVECADVLLRPLISWIEHTISEETISDMDIFKVYGSLNFVASLLEHPRAKVLLLNTSSIMVLVHALKRCGDAWNTDEKMNPENKISHKNPTSILCWCMPLLKSLALIFEPPSIELAKLYDEYSLGDISDECSSSIGCQLLMLCQVLPVGRELLACLVALKEFTSSSLGRRALEYIFSQFQTSTNEDHKSDEKDVGDFAIDKTDWRSSPPFLHCWRKLLSCLDSEDDASTFAIEIIYALSSCALHLCIIKDFGGISLLKFLFGLPYTSDSAALSSDERSKDALELLRQIQQKMLMDNFASSTTKHNLLQVKTLVKSVLLLLETPLVSSSKLEENPNEASHSATIVDCCTETTSLLLSTVDITAIDVEASFSHIWKLNEGIERDSEPWSQVDLAETFMWECPDSASERPLPTASAGKRKITSAEVSAKRTRDGLVADAAGSNAFSRGTATSIIQSIPSRRDTFRLRKPNTSRPPSMHVDDYVARERNIDGLNSSSHVSSSQRGGSSGRPPSIHVDEFMARQRERQGTTFLSVGEAAQIRQATFENQTDSSKLDKSRQLKTDLDDDLQGIDIVFDEESGSEDRLPFPQPDENLHSTPLIMGGSSPGSVVEETEGDINDGAEDSQVGSSVPSEEVESRSETSLKRSFQPELVVSADVSISSENNAAFVSAEKTFFAQKSEVLKNLSLQVASRGFEVPLAESSSVLSSLLNPSSAPTIQPLLAPTFHQRDNVQKTTSGTLPSGSYGYYEHKVPINQPPLPPIPHPNVSTMSTQSMEPLSGFSPFIHHMREMQAPVLSGYPGQPFNVSGATSLHVQLENAPSVSSLVPLSQPLSDNKLLWKTDSPTSTNISTRTTPPLPPTPPPYSTSLTQSTPNFSSQSSLYMQSTNGAPVTDLGIFSASGANIPYSLPPFTPSMLVSRPGVGGALFGSPSQQHGPNPTGISQPSPQLSIQSLQVQPPPPPPPQPRPPHPSQNVALPIQVPQPRFEQMMSLPQGSIQLQMQPLQQQLHMPQLQFFYPTQQQEQLPHSIQPPLEAQVKNSTQGTDITAQQQKDSGMTLQEYFSSPEAIQSLLSDRDKLCQLLEQHPKLMQMLQERLGQL